MIKASFTLYTSITKKLNGYSIIISYAMCDFLSNLTPTLGGKGENSKPLSFITARKPKIQGCVNE
jgi:hypothetical protein